MKQLNLSKRSKQFVEFYTFADEYRAKHGGEFDFRNTRSVKVDTCRCRGFYDSETKQIVSAVNHKLFEETFVHEFCHFMQDIEKDPVFSKARDDFWDDLEADKWRLKSWDSILDYIALERDCERRVIKMSRKYDLFDNAQYAQISNSYLYFYHYVFLTGKWVPTGKLYNSNLRKQMPDKILPLKTFEKIDMEIMKEYDKVLGVK